MRYDDKFLNGLKFHREDGLNKSTLWITVEGIGSVVTYTHAMGKGIIWDYSPDLDKLYREWWFDTYGGPG